MCATDAPRSARTLDTRTVRWDVPILAASAHEMAMILEVAPFSSLSIPLTERDRLRESVILNLAFDVARAIVGSGPKLLP